MKKQNCLKQHPLPASRRKVQLGFCRLNVLVATLSLTFVVAPLGEAQAQILSIPHSRFEHICAGLRSKQHDHYCCRRFIKKRAQTWQDRDGSHVVIPYATALNSVRSLKGVKVRQAGTIAGDSCSESGQALVSLLKLMTIA